MPVPAKTRMLQIIGTRPPGRGSLTLEQLARETGLHPDLILRLVRSGLVEPQGGSAGALRFAARDAALLARAERLRRDLGVNYAGAVLATELLTRIDELEQRLRDGTPTHRRHEVITWTRTG